MSKKLCGTKQRGPVGREMDRRVSQEPTHSGTHTIAVGNIRYSICERKPKIKWSKLTEKPKFKKFDDQVNNLLRRQKGAAERPKKLAEMIYDEGLKRFDLKNVNPLVPGVQ